MTTQLSTWASSFSKGVGSRIDSTSKAENKSRISISVGRLDSLFLRPTKRKPLYNSQRRRNARRNTSLTSCACWLYTELPIPQQMVVLHVKYLLRSVHVLSIVRVICGSRTLKSLTKYCTWAKGRPERVRLTLTKTSLPLAMNCVNAIWISWSEM
jgi:hypothetical protein